MKFLAVVHSRAQLGVVAPPVSVEVHLSNGLPKFNIVGLAETAVKESKDRVRSALINSRFDFPMRRITVNLAPADLPKEGGRFDLPIAIGILVASGQLKANDLTRYEFFAELALTGEVRPTRGILPAVLAATADGRAAWVARANAAEATLSRRATVYAADSLLEITAHLTRPATLAQVRTAAAPVVHDYPDVRDVRGQTLAKRALEVAASGGHSLLMMGPPGTGKTMLAARLPGILPGLNESEALEVASLKSLTTSTLDTRGWNRRPFRSPHHSASSVALVGGGSHPKPGEISLAHHGVLFLDELPEYSRHVLEHLREPLESGVINISRAARQVTYPASFQLIAAMNPCPCGYLGDDRCRCTADQVQKYRARISGPLLDRIDMHITVAQVPREVLRGKPHSEASAAVRRRVVTTREIQRHRCGSLNSRLTTRELETICVLDEESERLLDRAMDKLRLSARAYHRILKVARTIADMSGHDHIAVNHVGEAIGYRVLDRQWRE